MKNRVILDSRINPESIITLQKYGFETILLPKSNFLEEPISAHPDMSVLKIDSSLFVANDIAHLFERDECIKCSREEKLHFYPENVMFNCAVIGHNVMCKKQFLHKTVLNYLEKNNYNIIDVKQGYAKCSICIVTDNAIITEDDNIYFEANRVGIDVLKIEKGHVMLQGYDYGFIGGASGLLNKNLLCFNGNLEKHPQASEIFDFCKKYSIEVISLNSDVLYDVGTVISF